MPLQATSGAASYDAFGGGVAAVPNYIEEVFSTYLYTGNGSTQTITNGIDLSTKGGLVWIKDRSAATQHGLTDTVRGRDKTLYSNLTNGEYTTGSTQDITAFNTTGFSLGTTNSFSSNNNGATYASWTFRKQPKFFDVVTYTGNGSTQSVAHSLGSIPGCIMVKRTDSTSQWTVYHRGLSSPNLSILVLNTTAASDADVSFWNNTAPTSTNFTVGNAGGVTNTNGATYVAYLFAHDAGGFGLTGTDNVISCGSFTTDGSGNATISLGYEPQWLLVKQSSGGTTYWRIWDTMRGWSVATLGGSTADLYPNDSAAENFGGANGNGGFPTATGFYANGGVFNASQTHIYIAIRRGPMKVPTSGTSVFEPFETTNSTSAQVIGSLSQPDMFLSKRTDGDQTWRLIDRLRSGKMLRTDSTDTETAASNFLEWDEQVGVQVTVQGAPYLTNDLQAHWLFRRAPSFFDEVCYTGTGSARTLTHNLSVVPQLMIVKGRSNALNWRTYNFFNGSSHSMNLNDDGRTSNIGDVFWNSTTPTSSVFSIGTDNSVNQSGSTFVAYLFATCAGVSKVGNYTGNGSSQTINCGFTGGARFVLIKRTNVEGDWYVWDSARGIVSGNDPHLSLNTTAAEVTSDDSIDTDSTGFVVNQVAATDINVTSASYIFLAIA